MPTRYAARVVPLWTSSAKTIQSLVVERSGLQRNAKLEALVMGAGASAAPNLGEGGGEKR